MKKLKDLETTLNLQEIKVKLPDHVYKASSLPYYKIENVPVYLQGWTNGNFFVKIDPNSSQIYPMFWLNVPSDILEWEIIE